MGLLELRRPWGFSPEARRGSQGASRAAPGKSGLHARGKGQRVMALESWEVTRASRRVEEGSFPSPGDLPDPGIELRSPALQADSLPTELSGKPKTNFYFPFKIIL